MLNRYPLLNNQAFSLLKQPRLRLTSVLICFGLLLAFATIFYHSPSLSQPRLGRELFTWGLCLGLIYLYWAGYQRIKATPPSSRWIWLGGILLTLLALSIPPFHSTDVFGYINRGWQQWHYGLNPYVFTVDQTPGWEQDPMITDHWVNNPSPYGFLYLQIAKALCAVGFGSKTITLFMFKATNALLHLLTALLIWAGLKFLKGKNKTAPHFQPVMGLYLYLWNPLMLIHSVCNGHNDIWMGFFSTAAILFTLMGHAYWLLPCLMAATLIKYGSVVLLPFAALYLAKNREWKALLIGGILSGVLFLATGWGYLVDWQSFHLAEINKNAFVSHGSLHSALFSVVKLVDKNLIPALYPYRQAIRGILKNILLLSYGLLYARLLWLRLRDAHYSSSQWIQDSLVAMLGLICFASLKFYPWYLGMFFPLVFWLNPRGLLTQFVLILSACQMLSITLIGQAHILNFVLMTGVPCLWIFRQWRNPQERITPPENPQLEDVSP